jgi:copper/silver efflux system protein
MPPGYHAEWSGQFEYMQRAAARMTIVVPVTLLVIFVLLYLNFGRLTETLIVMLSVPFALVGGIWLMYLMHFNISVAAAVGFIALAGVAAETGVIMLIYLDHALGERMAAARLEERALTQADLRGAVTAGAVERVRPKMMTVTAIMAGLLPILWSSGAGSELMRRIAAPMVGGMLSSAVLTLLVIPAIYALVKGWRLPPQPTQRRGQPAPGPAGPAPAPARRYTPAVAATSAAKSGPSGLSMPSPNWNRAKPASFTPALASTAFTRLSPSCTQTCSTRTISS